jgi:hypothetical protein
MNKQITFEGDYCTDKAITWLTHFSECFDIDSLDMKTYWVEGSWRTVKRCKLILKYH